MVFLHQNLEAIGKFEFVNVGIGNCGERQQRQ
jgi:hypothetical protein